MGTCWCKRCHQVDTLLHVIFNITMVVTMMILRPTQKTKASSLSDEVVQEMLVAHAHTRVPLEIGENGRQARKLIEVAKTIW